MNQHKYRIVLTDLSASYLESACSGVLKGLQEQWAQELKRKRSLKTFFLGYAPKIDPQVYSQLITQYQGLCLAIQGSPCWNKPGVQDHFPITPKIANLIMIALQPMRHKLQQAAKGQPVSHVFSRALAIVESIIVQLPLKEIELGNALAWGDLIRPPSVPQNDKN